MSAAWLEIDADGGPRRHPLERGLTRVGGAGCEIEVDAAGADQLHVWDQPAKVVFVGKGEPPRVGGRALDESRLAHGDLLEWRGVRLRYVLDPAPAVLEEIPIAQAASGQSGPLPDARAWMRVRAGLLAELGLVERGATKRWQEAVLRGEFDPDACALDLDRAATATAGDKRLIERAGRLLRDLLMAPYQRGLRGAGRRARGAARSGLAYVLAQVAILLVFAILFGIALLVVRLRWDWSVDAFLDSLVDLIPG